MTTKNQENTTNSTHSQSISAKFCEKLKKRGLRGLVYLHRQFLMTCANLNTITLNDFIKVFNQQRFDFTKEESERLFKNFQNKNQSKTNNNNNNDIAFLNFSGFIRSFKKVLNERRLDAVEKAFSVLDEDKIEMLFLDDIKMKFNAKSHPDCIKNKRNEDELILEFIDCFELNYSCLVYITS